MSPDTRWYSSNLVTSLIQHEQVKTTLPKARDAARLAEKVRVFFLIDPQQIRNREQTPSFLRARRLRSSR